MMWHLLVAVQGVTWRQILSAIIVVAGLLYVVPLLRGPRDPDPPRKTVGEIMTGRKMSGWPEGKR